VEYLSGIHMMHTYNMRVAGRYLLLILQIWAVE